MGAVSIPYRKYKKLAGGEGVDGSRRVSIPYRKYKKDKLLKFVIRSSEVSIPYRKYKKAPHPCILLHFSIFPYSTYFAVKVRQNHLNTREQ